MAGKKKSSSSISPAEARKALRKHFKDRGYCRMPDIKRREAEGSASYRKGYEVRLPCDSKAEAGRVVKMIQAVGLNPGKPFAKGSGFAVPIYGFAAVEWFVPSMKAPVMPAAKKTAKKKTAKKAATKKTTKKTTKKKTTKKAAKKKTARKTVKKAAAKKTAKRKTAKKTTKKVAKRTTKKKTAKKAAKKTAKKTAKRTTRKKKR